MNTIQVDDIHFKTASTWNELTRGQLLYIAGQFRYWQWLAKKNYSFTRQRILLLMKLMGVSKYNIFSKRRKLFFELRKHPDEFYDLLKTTEFLQKENNLTKQLLPSFRHGFAIYYGPEDRLKNVSLNEFAFADTFYHRYRVTNDLKWLNSLVATLYRPGNIKNREEHGDIRDKFNNHTMDGRVSIMKHVDEKIKQAVLLWYIGCRAAMVKKYENVFSSKKKSNGKNSGWETFILDVAGGKFGDVEKTKQTNIHSIFLLIEISSQKK